MELPLSEKEDNIIIFKAHELQLQLNEYIWLVELIDVRCKILFTLIRGYTKKDKERL